MSTAFSCQLFLCSLVCGTANGALLEPLDNEAVHALQKSALFQKPPSRPNILFLMTDSMDGRLLDESTRESSVMDFPFLRKVFGRQGTTFRRAYSNNPLCVPSRSSLMTGRSSEKLRVWGNDRGLAASPGGQLDEMCVKAYGERRCREWADWQNYPGTILSTFTKLGYNVRAEGRIDIGGAYANEEVHNGTVPGSVFSIAFAIPTTDDFTRQAGITVKGENGTLMEFTEDRRGHFSWSQKDTPLAQRCADFIHGLPEPAEAVVPFFLYCSFSLPHYPYKTTRQWLERIDERQVFTPRWQDGFPNQWHPYDAFKSAADGIVGELNETTIRRFRRVYYALCAEADHSLGLVWQALMQKGYTLQDTYVIYASDHGEMALDHRQWGKSSMYEGSVRVPFMVAGPGIEKGATKSHLVSLLDVFPTLLDMAGESSDAVYADMLGSSVLQVAGGKSVAPPSHKLLADNSRDFVVSQYNWDRTAAGAYMVRSGPWKLILFGHTYSHTESFLPQLFDLQTDPEELTNVAAQNPEVVAELRQRLQGTFDLEKVDRDAAWVYYDHARAQLDNTTQIVSKKQMVDHAHWVYQAMSYWEGWEIEQGAQQKFETWINEATTLFPNEALL